ncbi:phosphoribosylaminoimidazolesuccinocarboxamide synthase [Aurantibacillus circumpalustris]|uniref:phosphoribosylaminoimidazolesuccinocarboxamide synthase n=1 Tax=Aurantibacillus circumpalustris TaxID=3036359 RepID=UPI00295B413E|nr:phosphoribosylaminoimidazolesuccinocarboxamide synthase [Aurantibacillus circumpalustris]
MTLDRTNYNLPGQTAYYKGKVRDVYTINKDILVMIASDRISAFDVVLPKGIPYKGQVLNQIAEQFLNATRDVVPNWLISTPHPNVSIGKMCQPFKVEMVVRGYLAGHAARTYSEGKRILCGVILPEGLKENDKLPQPIITPTTKASEGHDEDISKEEIIKQNIVSKEYYEQLEKYTLALYKRGQEIANKMGLILVDTKYEFGLFNNEITLMDEIHTPDSSRYFYLEGYETRQQKGEEQKQLSKEFVRRWLIENGFQGKEGQVVPEMDEKWINEISARYIELFEKVTGRTFVKANATTILKDVEEAILKAL